MDEYHSLLLELACLVVVLPLEWSFDARVVRRPRRWLASIVPAAVLLVTWDAAALARGPGGVDGRYLTGLRLRELVPVETLVLAVVVPTCALLVHEALGAVVDQGDGSRRARLVQYWGTVLVLGGLATLVLPLAGLLGPVPILDVVLGWGVVSLTIVVWRRLGAGPRRRVPRRAPCDRGALACTTCRCPRRGSRTAY